MLWIVLCVVNCKWIKIVNLFLYTKYIGLRNDAYFDLNWWFLVIFKYTLKLGEMRIVDIFNFYGNRQPIKMNKNRLYIWLLLLPFRCLAHGFCIVFYIARFLLKKKTTLSGTRSHKITYTYDNEVSSKTLGNYNRFRKSMIHKNLVDWHMAQFWNFFLKLISLSVNV